MRSETHRLVTTTTTFIIARCFHRHHHQKSNAMMALLSSPLGITASAATRRRARATTTTSMSLPITRRISNKHFPQLHRHHHHKMKKYVFLARAWSSSPVLLDECTFRRSTLERKAVQNVLSSSSSTFRHFHSNETSRRTKHLTSTVVPRALTNNGDGDEEIDGSYEEDFDDDNDESFYVGDVECIADVSFVSDVDGNGDVKLMAKKLKMEEEKMETMRERLEKDSRAILKLFVDASSESNSKNSNSINGSSSNGDIYLRLRENLGDDFPEQLSHVELSVALCDDAYIQALNKEWRSKDMPTDVLSFPNGGEEEGIAAFGPICVLGDIIISIETARAQAKEVGHSVEDELRVLLTHGFAHLLGFDHELGEKKEKDMKELEREIMVALGWDYIKDGGLIDRVSSSSSEASKKVLVVDLDGTLLNESSRVSDRVAKVLLEASKDESTLIVVATGKARPAAKAALATNPLLKDSLIVSESSPGIFLNGGASFGENGVPIIDDALPVECVRKAFEQKYDEEFALTAFTSDDRCLTLQASPFLDELHERYHEPKSEILASVDDIITQSRGQVKKMLLIGPNKDAIDRYLPEFSNLFIDTTVANASNSASVTRAVSTMLEVVPKNVDKSRAVSALLDSLVLANESGSNSIRKTNYLLVVVGDGDNDAGMIEFAASMKKGGIEGFGVAMGNASERSRKAASVILDETNADDGAAVAIERFIL